MDNKLTKKRLNDMFSYEWIAMIAVIVAVVLVWEILFSILSVKLSVGQQFKFYYDYDIDTSGSWNVEYLLSEKETFSYDVLKIEAEAIEKDDTVLLARLKTQDGDAIFTNYRSDDDGVARANTLIDNTDFTVYNFERLEKDAVNYLKTFLEDETSDPLVYENLSETKIEESFLERMKKDNRFRSDSEKQEGILQEKQRIKRLCKEVSDFTYLLTVGDSYDVFYRYTKFKQSYDANSENQSIKSYYENEISQGRGNAIYGIKMENLNGGAHSGQDYVKLTGETDAGGVVLMVFDYRRYQPDLQFEVISFINAFVGECSNIYSGRL